MSEGQAEKSKRLIKAVMIAAFNSLYSYRQSDLYSDMSLEII